MIGHLLLNTFMSWFYDVIKGHPGLCTYQPIIHSLQVLLKQNHIEIKQPDGKTSGKR